MPKGKVWTDKEILILRTRYNSLSGRKIAGLLPGRSCHAVRVKAFNLGLSKPLGSTQPWTVEEIRILKEWYPKVGPGGMLEKLPGRTYRAIQRMAWCNHTHRMYLPRKEACKNSQLKTKYGISLRQYNKLLGKQQGLCAICGQPEVMVRKGKVQNLSVDHCHSTGRVRGLLCSSCNPMLGLSREDISILAKAITYLEDN